MKKDHLLKNETTDNKPLPLVNEQRSSTQAFLDVQENLSQYSDKELEELFKNEDLQEDLNCSAYIKQALVSEESTPDSAQDNDIDINGEWNQFKQKYYPQHQHSWRKIAATVISIIMISGFTFAAILLQQNFHNQAHTSAAHSTSSKKTSITTAQQQNRQETPTDSTLTHQAAPVVFENTELAKILEEMGKYYGKQVIFKSEVQHLRLHFEWNKELTLQQNITLLNSFNHINISLENNKIIVE